MLVLSLIMTGFAFFLLGIILGNIYSGKKCPKTAPRHSKNTISVESAYKDFFEYDGSEQVSAKL